MNNAREAIERLEREVSEQKISNYKGTAFVHLSALTFPNPVRPIDQGHVARLKRVFDKEGCRRLELEHHIPAIIDDASLQVAMHFSDMSIEMLRAASAVDPPELRFPEGTVLECLHGRHRIMAAQQHLSLDQFWWTIDIYGEGLSEKAKRSFRETYSYGVNFTDGEVFRQIRFSSLLGDQAAEQRWRSRISPTKERDLRQLWKRIPIMNAFDDLLPMRGFWKALKLGSLDNILTPRCDEEMLHYLNHLHHTWTGILDNDVSLLDHVDDCTVDAVQLRAPHISRVDRNFLHHSMTSGTLFPSIKDASTRGRIKENLLSVKHLIPSLHTFLEDLKYLKPCAKIMRRLLSNPIKTTLHQAFHLHFSEFNDTCRKIPIQTDEFSFSQVEGSQEECFQLSYRQLWLYSFRHFPLMGGYPPRKDKGTATPTMKEANGHLWYKFAELAYFLGFRSVQIDRFRCSNSDEYLIPRFLHTVRPEAMYSMDVAVPQEYINASKQALTQARQIRIERERLFISSSGSGEPLGHRCGRPYERSQVRDRQHLFLDKLNAPLAAYDQNGDNISSFYVRRAVYHAFFGMQIIELPEMRLSLSGNSNDLMANRQPVSNHLDQATVGTLKLAAPPGTKISKQNSDKDVSCLGFALPALLTSRDNESEVGNRTVEFIGSAGNSVIPFTKPMVYKTALEFAHKGLHLEVPGRGYVVYYQCYEELQKTGIRRVQVKEPIEISMTL